MIGWIAAIYLAWFILRFMHGTSIERDKAKSFDKLVNKVQTDENKQRVQQLILFHNKRVMAGAVGEESLARLTRDLKELGGIKEEEELF